VEVVGIAAVVYLADLSPLAELLLVNRMAGEMMAWSCPPVFHTKQELKLNESEPGHEEMVEI